MASGILVTRPAAHAAETSRRLRALGFDPLPAPLLDIVGRAGPVHVPGPVAALAVTSASAVPAILPAWRNRPVFTVGDATAEAARAAGCTDLRSADGTATELAGVISRSILSGAVTGTVLLLVGARQGGALAAALRRDGVRVVRRVAYEAVPVDRMPDAALNALRAGDVHGALFMSGATAAQFTRVMPAGLIPALSGVVAACISAGAAAPVRHLPWRDLRVSSNPNLMDTLALL